MSNEISGEGNSYTAEFWQYDARLGRRWNTDPVLKPWESPYSAFGNNPILLSDPYGDNVDSNRTKGMNFVVIPSKAARDADIQEEGKIGSAYNVDAGVFKRMSKRSKGELQVIEADCATEAIAEIKKRLGADGFVENIIIDYHKRGTHSSSLEGAFTDEFGNLTQGAKEAFKDLAKGYAGVNTKCYLGQCWAGGYHDMTTGNLTQETSDLLDGATVYGHQASASSFGLFVSKSFVGWMFKEYGTNPEGKAKRGYHTVSFYHPKLGMVMSVEIKDKIKILTNGAIHSNVSDIKSLPATRINPASTLIPPPPVLPSEEIGPPNGN